MLNLLTLWCAETRGANSDGMGGAPPPKGDPPKPGLALPRALSNSVHPVSKGAREWTRPWIRQTFNAIINGRLDWRLKDCPVLPHIHYPPELRLDISSSPFVCNGYSLRHNRREGDDEVVLMPDLGLLSHFCTPGSR